MSIRKKVLKRMGERGLQKKDVASHLRIAVPTFSSWLNGKTHLPYSTIWLLWELLDLRQEDLLDVM